MFFSFWYVCVSDLWTYNDITQYSDVIMGAIASQITSLVIVYSTVIQTQIKENI